ncbi:hypothetical protein K3495_g11430 [Podosphaera aphanis]|nr:hypothetical protein K3495_g11430 [Podosphaera aphanis]
MTGWDPVRRIARKKRAHSPEKEYPESDTEGTPYDQIKTDWDSVRSTAGQKRAHSLEREYTPTPTQTMKTRSDREVKKHDYKRLHCGKAAQVSSDSKTWSEAMTSPEALQWKRATDDEFRTLKEKGAIKIIPRTQLPQGRKPMKCKWKARCTAKGFTQRQGIDYNETFALTPRPETGRIMLVLAHQFGWHRRQGDVPTDFLNPDLDIDLYIEMPQGYEKE